MILPIRSSILITMACLLTAKSLISMDKPYSVTTNEGTITHISKSQYDALINESIVLKNMTDQTSGDNNEIPLPLTNKSDFELLTVYLDVNQDAKREFLAVLPFAQLSRLLNVANTLNIQSLLITAKDLLYSAFSKKAQYPTQKINQGDSPASSTSRYAIDGYNKRVAIALQDGAIYFADSIRETPLKLKQVEIQPKALAFSKDGSFFGYTQDTNLSIIADRETSKKNFIKQISLEKPINTICFNHKTTQIAVSTTQGTVYIFDIYKAHAKKENEYNSIKSDHPITCMAFDHGGSLLAAGCQDGTIIMVDLHNFKINKYVDTSTNHEISAIAFDEKDDNLAFCRQLSPTINIINPRTLKLIKQFKSDGTPYLLKFIPRTHILASSDRESTNISLWHTDLPHPIAKLRQQQEVFALDHNYFGNLLITQSTMWDIEPIKDLVHYVDRCSIEELSLLLKILTSKKKIIFDDDLLRSYESLPKHIQTLVNPKNAIEFKKQQ